MVILPNSSGLMISHSTDTVFFQPTSMDGEFFMAQLGASIGIQLNKLNIYHQQHDRV